MKIPPSFEIGAPNCLRSYRRPPNLAWRRGRNKSAHACGQAVRAHAPLSSSALASAPELVLPDPRSGIASRTTTNEGCMISAAPFAFIQACASARVAPGFVVARIIRSPRLPSGTATAAATWSGQRPATRSSTEESETVSPAQGGRTEIDLHRTHEAQQQSAGQAEGMKHRQRIEADVSEPDVEACSDLSDVCEKIGVRQRHALWRALRA
jgi:hypothetical protein